MECLVHVHFYMLKEHTYLIQINKIISHRWSEMYLILCPYILRSTSRNIIVNRDTKTTFLSFWLDWKPVSSKGYLFAIFPFFPQSSCLSLPCCRSILPFNSHDSVFFNPVNMFCTLFLLQCYLAYSFNLAGLPYVGISFPFSFLLFTILHSNHIPDSFTDCCVRFVSLLVFAAYMSISLIIA